MEERVGWFWEALGLLGRYEGRVFIAELWGLALMFRVMC